MDGARVPTEPTIVRRAFPTWSIEIPESFEETFVDDGSYWHAYTDDRSVSLTSLQITDGTRPVPATEIIREMDGVISGEPVIEGPDGLLFRAAIDDAPKSSRASRLLSGLIASDGRVLLVTITSDDLDWARKVWLSIRGRGAPPAWLTQAARRSGPRPPCRRTCAGRRTRGR